MDILGCGTVNPSQYIAYPLLLPFARMIKARKQEQEGRESKGEEEVKWNWKWLLMVGCELRVLAVAKPLEVSILIFVG